MKMTKIKKFETVFHETYEDAQPTWKELKDFELQDDDLVTISYEEPYYSENNSYAGHWFIDVQRIREETDEEYQERIKANEVSKEMLRKNRYQQYLKLKKEFENEQ
jgi:hypothetical protein